MISLFQNIHIADIINLKLTNMNNLFDIENFCNKDNKIYQIQYCENERYITHHLYNENDSTEYLHITNNIEDCFDILQNNTINICKLESILIYHTTKSSIFNFNYKISNINNNLTLIYDIEMNIDKYIYIENVYYFRDIFKNTTFEINNAKINNSKVNINNDEIYNNIKYDYIKSILNKMTLLETTYYFNIPISLIKKFNNNSYLYYNTITNKFNLEHDYISILFNGGIIIKNNYIDIFDAFVNLININKCKGIYKEKHLSNIFYCKEFNNKKIKIKATLLVIPSFTNCLYRNNLMKIHDDLKKINNSLKIIILYNISDKVYFNDIADIDIIILTTQYLYNYDKSKINKIDNLEFEIYNTKISNLLSYIYFNRIVYFYERNSNFKHYTINNYNINTINTILDIIKNNISYNKFWMLFSYDNLIDDYEINFLLNNINYNLLIKDIKLNNENNFDNEFTIDNKINKTSLIDKYCNNIKIYKNNYINELLKYIVIVATIYDDIIIDEILEKICNYESCLLDNKQLNYYNLLPKSNKKHFLSNISFYLSNNIEEVLDRIFLYKYNISSYHEEIINNGTNDYTNNEINDSNKYLLNNISKIYNNTYNECCIICLEDIQKDDHCMLSCGHVYCSNCLVKYINIQMKKKYAIKCLCSLVVAENNNILYTSKKINEYNIDKINKLKFYINKFINSKILIFVNNSNDIIFLKKYLLYKLNMTINRFGYVVEYYYNTNIDSKDSKHIYIVEHKDIIRSMKYFNVNHNTTSKTYIILYDENIFTELLNNRYIFNICNSTDMGNIIILNYTNV